MKKGIQVVISTADKVRIERLRKFRTDRKKWQHRRETAADVIHRALDALEELK